MNNAEKQRLYREKCKAAVAEAERNGGIKIYPQSRLNQPKPLQAERIIVDPHLKRKYGNAKRTEEIHYLTRLIEKLEQWGWEGTPTPQALADHNALVNRHKARRDVLLQQYEDQKAYNRSRYTKHPRQRKQQQLVPPKIQMTEAQRVQALRNGFTIKMPKPTPAQAQRLEERREWYKQKGWSTELSYESKIINYNR
jgi:hypothetical protein